jgi:hypothetical protein
MSRNGRHKKAAHSARLSIWWAHTDLNRGPKDYELVYDYVTLEKYNVGTRNLS